MFFRTLESSFFGVRNREAANFCEQYSGIGNTHKRDFVKNHDRESGMGLKR